MSMAYQIKHLGASLPLLRELRHTFLSLSSPSIIRAVKMSSKNATMENINQNIVKMEYAVRGPIVIKAAELEKELKNGVKKPFEQVIRANIGDCHAMGQKPLTFLRQVLTLCTYPKLMDMVEFPEDVRNRVFDILGGCAGNSVGAYTDSTGLEVVRRHVAKYIEQRDNGISSDHLSIFLSSGASEAIKNLLQLLNAQRDGKKPGVMIPIPQYPLYSATITEFGMHQISYYLDEEHQWALDIQELERAVKEAKNTCYPRVLVVINPGNPTGSVLTRENIEEVIKFAHREKLFLLADEVYQDNVYAPGMKFHSLKKVLMEMGPPYNQMELASVMSCSKGYMGECGLRGGYCELVNMDPAVKATLFKMLSAKLCSSVLGQAAMDCVVNPPKPGEPSYSHFMEEKTAVLGELKKRALLVEKTFNSIPGFRCNPVAGAMYAFPRITLPKKAQEAAKSKNQAPDAFYALQLLEKTGICIVPGSGFGQIPGTFHFRTTILPPTEKLVVMLDKIKQFHAQFVSEYE